MYLRPVSDLHNEATPWDIPELDTDHETVLILAGDIDLRARSVEWIAGFSNRFLAVVMVMGNHDYWKDSLDTAPQRLRNKLAEVGLTNVHLLDSSTVTVNDPTMSVRFVGATLWTDFDKGNPLAMHDALANMKDYKKIRNKKGTANLHTRAILTKHTEEKAYIRSVLETPFDGHTFVVTHHAPSPQSIAAHFNTASNKYMNAAYHSNMEEWAKPLAFTIWFHGHTHNNFDYPFGEAGRVMCNPRGYIPTEPNPDFNPELLIDVSKLQPVVAKEFEKAIDYATWWGTMDSPSV